MALEHVGEGLDDPSGNRVDQPGCNVTHGDGDGQRHTAFTGRAVRSRDHRIGSHLHVGVGEHQSMVLGSAKGLDTLAPGGAGLIDVPGDRRRAHEADGGNVGVGQQCVDGLLVALDNSEDAIGQTGVLPHLGQEQRRRGVLLARFEDEGVATGDGVGTHPQGHHHREVERGDAGHHAQRLTDRVDVHPGRDLFREPALEQRWCAGSELDVLQAAGNLAGRIGQDLSMLGRDDRRKLAGALVQ